MLFSDFKDVSFPVSVVAARFFPSVLPRCILTSLDAILNRHDGETWLIFLEQTMEIRAATELTAKKCKPCEGGVEPCTQSEAENQLKELPDWYLTNDGQRIRRDWTVKNFMAGLDLFNRVGKIAEEDGHHPDLHIEGYRNVWIELWTHAIGGLSENDFILAAKIDQVPVELK